MDGELNTDLFRITELGASHTPEPGHCLAVENLHVHYGAICALADVSFSIGCGHCVGLLGQNGAGKSTLLKSIAGLHTRLSGSLTWRGQPLRAVRQEIAYLPQRDQVDPFFPLTVRGLVEMGRYPHLGERGRWRPLDSEVVDSAIETLKLGDLQKRRLYQLSGGQLQRAHIARALAQEAHVLLLDEPFAGLDEPSQRMLGEVLRELAANGRLLMVCHHDLKAVPELFDTVLLLNRKLVGFGPVTEAFTPEALRAAFDTPPEEAHV
jgi:ABC-type Mn2+/Zn2+ transport system ATPase subunit